MSIAFLLYHLQGIARICFVHLDNGKIRTVNTVDFFLQKVRDYIIPLFIVEGNYDIKNNIRMGRPFDHTEIVKADFWIIVMEQICQQLFQVVCLFVIGDDRVHMYDGFTMKLVKKPMFNIVNHIM